MTVQINNFNNTPISRKYNGENEKPMDTPKFIKVPIQQVEKLFTKTVDTFVPEPKTEEQKKSHKKVITVTSTVIVLSALATLFNPRFSSKFLKKLQVLSQQAEANIQKNKDNYLKSKFHTGTQKVYNGLFNFAQFTNTINATKDIGFKWLCSADKFNGVKNDTARNILKKTNKGFTRIMTPINNGITNWFDNLGKKTVYRKYKNASRKMDSLDNIINLYINKISKEDQEKLRPLLEDIYKQKRYCSQDRIQNRLTNQEDAMKYLEKAFKEHLFNSYLNKFEINSPRPFGEKIKHNADVISDNMSYWAEDMLTKTRSKIEAEGKTNIAKLFGNGKDKKGAYQEVIDILTPHLKEEEKALLNKNFKQCKKTIKEAHRTECIEYFDKKRDLMLGGAPTDVLTNLGFLGLSGIAISNAENKEDKISKVLTVGFPAAAGIGTSIAMTAMLFSGVTGMALGLGTAQCMSLIGNEADKLFNPKKEIDDKTKIPKDVKDITKPKEAQYA